MPVEVAIWRIDGGVRKLVPMPLQFEARLEKAIEGDVSILGLQILVVGRQVPTAFGKRIDLLGLDEDGDLYVVELKRDRTPREVVAQSLEYGSWVKDLGYEQVSALFAEYSAGRRLEEAFEERFGQPPPEALNEQHHLVIVASELDGSTERIVSYLSSQYGVPINALFFRYLQDGEREYLARTWLLAPSDVEASAKQPAAKRAREAWNGQDFYVALGEGETRNWDDCRRYGFVSGGGGHWYWKTLESLQPGHRVFVCIPKTGYVGVGTVEEPMQKVSDFVVAVEDRRVVILQAPLKAPAMAQHVGDPDKEERLVRVKWVKTLPREQAIWEKGMYANQNTATALRNSFTLERLTERFGLDAS